MSCPMIFGEVLFDQFPDGRSVLGGAPFNVAWNLHGLGLQPLFISSVGRDENGDEVIRRMTAWGMSREGVQRNRDKPTGVVAVSLNGGVPTYEIRSDQAYDFIESAPLHQRGLAERLDISLIYHGSLALRNKVSRETLFELRRTIDAPIFVDVNVRPPWFDLAEADSLLKGARWIKVNTEELGILTGRRLAEDSPSTTIGDSVARLRRRHPCEICFVTAGAVGAYAVDDRGQVIFIAAPVVESIADTVGAGDAFAAMTIAGLFDGAPLDRLLQRAVHFAAGVCQIRGATTEELDFYKQGRDARKLKFDRELKSL